MLTAERSDMGMVSVREPVSALVKFSRGKVFPVKFLWHRRVHRIVEITGRWRSRSGRADIYHLSVVGENGTYYEISFNSETFIWLLDKIEAE